MNRSIRNGKSGMTLVEILIVVALLGALAAVLIRSLGGVLEDGKKDAAKLFCKSAMGQVIGLLKHKNGGSIGTGTLPLANGATAANWTNLSKIDGSISATGAKDPWGNVYGLEVVNAVPGAPGTPAHVFVWSTMGAGAPVAVAAPFQWVTDASTTQANIQTAIDNGTAIGAMHL